MEEKTAGRLVERVRISGYLVAGGALVGFSLGLYFLFNRSLFSLLIPISQFEVLSYFLGVFVPSFAILIIIGYLFATTLGLERMSLPNLVPLCVLSLLCMVFSALSVFYLISFLGGFLALTVLIKDLAKPMFKTLSKGEAFFLAEIGAMFVVSFSLLFTLVWLISKFFPTYALGFYRGYSPYALLWVGFLFSLVFFAIPLIDPRGKNPGWCGAFGLVTSVLCFPFLLQNRYVLLSPPAYIGVFMLFLGYVTVLTGDLIYMRLFFLQRAASATIQVSPLLHHGKYCPHCGKLRASSIPPQIFCYHCGRSLMWTPRAPFCSSCGLLVPAKAQTCPHCQEDIRSKRIYFHLKDVKEQAIASKLITKYSRKKSWIVRGLMKMSKVLLPLRRVIPSVNEFFNLLTERLSILPDVFSILFATCLFLFLFLFALRMLVLRMAS